MRLKSKFEYILQNSGVPYTIFKLSGFYQGLIGQYALPILEQQPIYVTKESMPVSYMDTSDVAKFCIKALELSNTKNSTFALGSPTAFLSTEIIKKCEELSGQTAKTNQLSIIGVKVTRKLANFFEWSWNIADRLAFIEVFSGKENFYILRKSWRTEPFSTDDGAPVDMESRKFWLGYLSYLSVCQPGLGNCPPS